MRKSDKFIIGTIVGGAIGSVLGLLFAPKPGKATRKAVSDASQKAIDWGKKQAEKVHGGEADKDKDDDTDEIDAAMKSIAKSAKKIKSSFKSLKKQTVDPAIQKLAKTREQEFDV